MSPPVFWAGAKPRYWQDPVAGRLIDRRPAEGADGYRPIDYVPYHLEALFRAVAYCCDRIAAIEARDAPRP